MNIRFEIDRNLLQLAAHRIQGAIVDRSLSFVALRVIKKNLEIAVNDQFLAVYSSFPCTAENDGFAFVQAQLFTEVVRELPEGQVHVFTKDQMLQIVAGKNKEFTMKIPLIEKGVWREPDDYSKTENIAEIPATKLAYMIDQVDFTIDPGCSRVFGTVGYLHRPKNDPELLRLVGTDSYRLSYCEIRTPMADSFLPEGICLTKKSLVELSRMASEGFEKVRLSVADGKYLVAEVPGFKLFLLLSTVRYPNYAGVLPKWDNKAKGVLVERHHLQGVARRVLLASDKSRILNLAFQESELLLSSRTIGSSEGKEIVNLEDFSGPKCDLTVNGKYLSDVFSSTSCDKLTLQFKTPSEPFVVMPYGEPSDCRTRHVLVPIDQHAH